MSHIADTLAMVKEIDVTYFIMLSLWFVLIFLVFVQYPFFFCSRAPTPAFCVGQPIIAIYYWWLGSRLGVSILRGCGGGTWEEL